MVLQDFNEVCELESLITEVSGNADKRNFVYENTELMEKIFKFTKTVDQKEKVYTRILNFIYGYWDYISGKK